MNYRNMLITDYDEVRALWRACKGVSLRDADSREGIDRYLQRNPGLSFVAENRSAIVGTLMAGHDGKRGYIQHLAVADSQRQQGIASHLLELCLAALKSEGIVKSHVHVSITNAPGCKFWGAQGWWHRAEIAMYSFINGGEENV
jgi:ribosomal protein S18 acetylase RimI-like enzyme